MTDYSDFSHRELVWRLKRIAGQKDALEEQLANLINSIECVVEPTDQEAQDLYMAMCEAKKYVGK